MNTYFDPVRFGDLMDSIHGFAAEALFNFGETGKFEVGDHGWGEDLASDEYKTYGRYIGIHDILTKSLGHDVIAAFVDPSLENVEEDKNALDFWNAVMDLGHKGLDYDGNPSRTVSDVLVAAKRLKHMQPHLKELSDVLMEMIQIVNEYHTNAF